MHYWQIVKWAFWGLAALTSIALALPFWELLFGDPIHGIPAVLFMSFVPTLPLYVSAVVCQILLTERRDYLSLKRPSEPSDHRRYTIPTAFLIAALAQAAVSIPFILSRINAPEACVASKCFSLGILMVMLFVALLIGFAVGLLPGYIVTLLVRRKRNTASNQRFEAIGGPRPPQPQP